ATRLPVGSKQIVHTKASYGRSERRGNCGVARLRRLGASQHARGKLRGSFRLSGRRRLGYLCRECMRQTRSRKWRGRGRGRARLRLACRGRRRRRRERRTGRRRRTRWTRRRQARRRADADTEREPHGRSRNVEHR
ncbi:translation initiation factor sui1 protein, partial [Toxoplasma gondii MAS]